jgi:anaerobic selenocysteine-containing dehydrogenase
MPGAHSLILPTLGRTEEDMQATGRQFVTVEDSFSMVHASEGIGKPLAETQKSETAIVAGIAHAVLGNSKLDWLALADDYNLIRDHIAATIPASTFQCSLREPGGFWLGNSAASLTFATPSGKAEFSSAPLPDAVCPEISAPFVLQTLRSHDQYNTTIYGLDDRYRGVYGQRDVLFMHPDDILALGLSDGDRVDITTLSTDGITRQVTGFRLVAYAIPRGNLAAYYPETNPLVPLTRYGDGTGTPTSKSIPVTITPSRSADTLRIA